VIGLPHEKWGEEVAAFIRPAPGAVIDKEELSAYMRASLAPHRPRGTGSWSRLFR
jgi:fatty-acyl-CoA synthase